MSDVDLAAAPVGDRDTLPYKGDASYYDLVTDDGTISDAIWTYEHRTTRSSRSPSTWPSTATGSE